MTRARPKSSHWAVPLGRLAGVPISLHLSFLLLVALVVASPGPDGVAAALAWVVAVFACVTVHELAHSLVARGRGGSVRSIVLLPIGGVSQIEHMPEGWANELAVAAAGPLASIGIAAAAATLAWSTGEGMWPPTLFAGGWATRLAWANVLLAGFNLLPAFPMDGGRVLRAVLERRHGIAAATRAAAVVGRVSGVLMILAGLVLNPLLAVIGILVIVTASGEEAATALHVHLRGVTARQVMRWSSEVVDGCLPLPVAVRPGPWVVVLGGTYLGMARGVDLGRASGRTVADLTDTGAGSLSPGEDLGETGLDGLLAAEGHLLPVVEDGKVLGVVTLEDATRWDGLRRVGGAG